VNARQVLVVAAVTALFAVMAASLVGTIDWPHSPTSIPVYDPNATSPNGVANSMFNSFAITIILVAILLGAAMIGGVYLGKIDEQGKVGP